MSDIVQEVGNTPGDAREGVRNVLRDLRREDVIAAVGRLPQASTHAAQLALDALVAALSQIKP